MYRTAVLTATVGLLGVGLVMVFSASAIRAGEEFGDPTLWLFRQGVWVILGGLAMIAVSSVDYRRLPALRWPLLCAAIALLAAVLLFGTTYNNARRWFRFGFVGIQPSEFAKLALLLFLAAHLTREEGRPRRIVQGWLVPCGVTALVLALILRAPDVGTTVFLGTIAFLVMTAAGCRVAVTVLLLAVAALYLPDLLPGEKFAHVTDRLQAFLHPSGDRLDRGYQPYQSLVALGSGGLLGTGLGQGLQRTYLPEQFTDFILAIIGEELGLAGTLGVTALFGLLFYGGFQIAWTARDAFGGLLAFGITSAITLQALINMAVVTVMAPTKGISLPLVSFGGSSLFFTLVSIGVLLSVGRAAEEEAENAENAEKAEKAEKAANKSRWGIPA